MAVWSGFVILRRGWEECGTVWDSNDLYQSKLLEQSNKGEMRTKGKWHILCILLEAL